MAKRRQGTSTVFALIFLPTCPKAKFRKIVYLISVWSVVFLKYPKNKHLYIVEEISTINPRFFMHI
jgi:hypothetical protein